MLTTIFPTLTPICLTLTPTCPTVTPTFLAPNATCLQLYFSHGCFMIIRGKVGRMLKGPPLIPRTYIFSVLFRCRCCRGWWNVATRPVLCVVRKVDYIWHPCADKLTHLSTYGYHIRSCLVWRNTTSSDLFHCSHQRTLYLEGSLIKILSCQGALLFLLVSCMKKKISHLYSGIYTLAAGA